MGFLNHSVNNIIVDATLTEKGREYLSRGGVSSLNITKYTFGDDEVDYSIISKYGILTGNEKIEKNTPIFEATTGQSLSLKYPLISNFSDAIIPLYIPEISVDVSSIGLVFNNVQSDFKTITLETILPGIESDFELQETLIDSKLKIYFDNTFIKVYDTNNSTFSSSQTSRSNVSHTTVTTNTLDRDFTGQKERMLKIKVSDTLTESEFTKYSIDSKIRTQLYIVGLNSTAKKVIPITITI